MEKIRAFIAVPATDEVRALIGQIEGELKPVGADVKWVEPGNVHITLKFLGNIDPDQVNGLCQALSDALRGSASFDVLVEGTGTFPSGRRAPRVVWIGLTDGKEGLIDLAGKVEGACSSLGFEQEDRPFKPHLTIGRVRRGSAYLRDLSDRVGRVEFNPLKLRVDRVNLVKSKLSPQGPTYTVLESSALEHTQGGLGNGSEAEE
jgi:2'-5' RNA ligase